MHSHQVVYAITGSAGRVVTGIVDPSPEPPPGSDGITKLFDYGIWGAMVITAAALLWGITSIAASMRNGGEVDGVKRTVLSIIVLTVLGAFGTFLGAFS